jgi:hypothetical protein
MKSFRLFMLALSALSAPVAAQEGCEPVPAEWAGWSASMAMTGDLEPGARSEMVLAPAGSLKLAATPGKEAVTGLYVGVAWFNVAMAGKVRIALDQGAWIDLVKDGAAISSTGHGHGPKCSGIRKIVDFELTPGRYGIQIVNAPKDRIGVMALLP